MCSKGPKSYYSWPLSVTPNRRHYLLHLRLLFFQGEFSQFARFQSASISVAVWILQQAGICSFPSISVNSELTITTHSVDIGSTLNEQQCNVVILCKQQTNAIDISFDRHKLCINYFAAFDLFTFWNGKDQCTVIILAANIGIGPTFNKECRSIFLS